MLALFCAAMPRAAFRAVGGLDEGYGRGLFEDDDLACAVRARGGRVGVARDVFVHHYGGAAFSKLPQSQYLRLWWENRRRFERKWKVRWQKR
jgi:GT2 family glycosyltransferase